MSQAKRPYWKSAITGKAGITPYSQYLSTPLLYAYFWKYPVLPALPVRDFGFHDDKEIFQ